MSNRKSKADIGDWIQLKDGSEGLVEKVYDNSVLVNLSIDGDDLSKKTIVNHKNYKIIDK